MAKIKFVTDVLIKMDFGYVGETPTVVERLVVKGITDKAVVQNKGHHTHEEWTWEAGDDQMLYDPEIEGFVSDLETCKQMVQDGLELKFVNVSDKPFDTFESRMKLVKKGRYKKDSMKLPVPPKDFKGEVVEHSTYGVSWKRD